MVLVTIVVGVIVPAIDPTVAPAIEDWTKILLARTGRKFCSEETSRGLDEKSHEDWTKILLGGKNFVIER